jgi:hypothetical protein
MHLCILIQGTILEEFFLNKFQLHENAYLRISNFSLSAYMKLFLESQ